MIYHLMGDPKSQVCVSFLSFFFLWPIKRDHERRDVPWMRKSNIDTKFSIQAYASKKYAILYIGLKYSWFKIPRLSRIDLNGL